MLEKTMAEPMRGVAPQDGFMLILVLFFGMIFLLVGTEYVDSSNSLISIVALSAGLFGVLLVLGVQFYVVIESLANALSDRRIFWIGAIVLTGTIAAWIYFLLVGDFKRTYQRK